MNNVKSDHKIPTLVSTMQFRQMHMLMRDWNKSDFFGDKYTKTCKSTQAVRKRKQIKLGVIFFYFSKYAND